MEGPGAEELAAALAARRCLYAAGTCGVLGVGVLLYGTRSNALAALLIGGLLFGGCFIFACCAAASHELHGMLRRGREQAAGDRQLPPPASAEGSRFDDWPAMQSRR